MGARRNQRKPWTIYSDRGVAFINTTIAGARFRRSLFIDYDPDTASARDVRAVEAAAARAYAKLVERRATNTGPESRIVTALPLTDVFGLWMVEAEKRWPRSYKTKLTLIGNVESWATDAPRFAKDRRPPIERLLDDSGPEQFVTDRLTQVLRGTVATELSNLYVCLGWCKREGLFRSLPPRPELPRGALGVRVGPQRSDPVDVTEEEALAIINAMPEWTAKGGGSKRGPKNKRAIRVRDRFRLCWELALRPGIANKISVPEHWSPGQDYLWISADIDKVGFARRIPLTKVARAILETCAPKRGSIFGEHALIDQIKAAAAAVLPPEKAKRFARYDFRHGRAVHTLDVTGDLLGTSRMLGHVRPTTTNQYLRTRESHVSRVVDALEKAAESRARTVSGTPAPENDDPNDTPPRGRKSMNHKEKPPEDHSSGGPASLRLPRTPVGPEDRQVGGTARQSAPESDPDPSIGVPGSSAERQHDVPAAITGAMRQAVFEKVVWDAHDLFSLHAMGIDLDEGDS